MNRLIRIIRHLGCYQAIKSVSTNASLQCRGNAEASSEVAFRCSYTDMNAFNPQVTNAERNNVLINKT